jgi:hypothetical protein
MAGVRFDVGGSRRVESNFGVKHHGIPDEIERIEAPIVVSTLADEFREVLEANQDTTDGATDCALRLFALHKFGLLEAGNKTDGVDRCLAQ